MKLGKRELAALSRIEGEKAFRGDPLVLAKTYRRLEEENAELKREYDEIGRGLKAIAGKPGYEIDCGWTAKGVADALLTKEQDNAAERSIDEIVEALENIARLAANTGNMPEYEDALNILFTIGGVAVKAIHKAKE